MLNAEWFLKQRITPITRMSERNKYALTTTGGEHHLVAPRLSLICSYVSLSENMFLCSYVEKHVFLCLIITDG